MTPVSVVHRALWAKAKALEFWIVGGKRSFFKCCPNRRNERAATGALTGFGYWIARAMLESSL